MFFSFPRRVLDSEKVHYIVLSRGTSYLLDASTFFFLRYCTLRRCYNVYPFCKTLHTIYTF